MPRNKTKSPYAFDPTPLRCERWFWSQLGHHTRCTNLATRESIIPGAIRMHTCEQCHQQRERAFHDS